MAAMRPFNSEDTIHDDDCMVQRMFIELIEHLDSSICLLQVDSKFLVGLGGILVVGCSVLASMGFYSWIGIPSSLVILQVVPFLVLAVGADNIFIFVLEYQVRTLVCTVDVPQRCMSIYVTLPVSTFAQRDVRRPQEKREEQIGRVLGNVAPSMLLCSLSESVCFFLGRNLCTNYTSWTTQFHAILCINP